jgi:putative transposase
MEYQCDEHRVHLIVFHLIWTPKRRKPVLAGAVGKDCQQIIRQKCADRGWEILELVVHPDHVHLFVRVRPSVPAAEVVKECKGASSRALRWKYPFLKRLPPLWTRISLPRPAAIGAFRRGATGASWHVPGAFLCGKTLESR